MNIMKILAPLEALETNMADLYEWLSHIHREDEEAASFFFRISVEEVVHANIVKYQRRLVSQNAKSFGEVDLDTGIIEQTLSEIGEVRNAAARPSLEEALGAAIRLEQSVAERHYLTAIEKSNPEVSRLLHGLGAFDCRHISVFKSFALSKGFAHLGGEAVSSGLPWAGGVSATGAGYRESGAVIPDKEFVDKIDCLYTWQNKMGYYKFLGINAFATDQEIREAYLRMVKEYHPDRHFDFPESIVSKLQAIVEYAVDARETLMNPAKRRAYDASLKSQVRH